MSEQTDWLAEAFRLHRVAMTAPWRTNFDVLYRYRNQRAAYVRTLQDLHGACVKAGCEYLDGVPKSIEGSKAALAAMTVYGTGEATVGLEYLLKQLHDSINKRANDLGRLVELDAAHGVFGWDEYTSARAADKLVDSTPADIELEEVDELSEDEIAEIEADE